MLSDLTKRVQSSGGQSEKNRKYISVLLLQGASRDTFLTNNLEPRPGRVEVQVNIHEGASKKRTKTVNAVSFLKMYY